MKMKSKLKVIPPAVLKQVDALGLEYGMLKDNQSQFNKKADENYDTIMKLADDFGAEDGNRRIVKGSEFIIGFTVRAVPYELNAKALFKKHPHLLKQLTKRVLDEEKVMTAIKEGVITRKLLKKFSRPKKGAKPVRAIYVRKINDETKKES